ncbi:MAG: pyridoxamine 5'-phosphate oxidase family protein [Candidatus Omnitrophota bacterium]
MKLSQELITFFKNQGFVVVSTIDAFGMPHNSCKGIVEIDKKNGLFYLLDVYKENTYNNLTQNHNIAVTAIDEHRFTGYSIKGKAKVVKTEYVPHFLTMWEDRINQRIARRFIRNIRGEKGHKGHPEARLPKPEYLIVFKAKDVIDLTPYHLKEKLK